MEVTRGAEDGFVREWTPCSHVLSLIPLRVQNGLFSNEMCLTCVDACTEYIALGTNVGLVYWYDRKKGDIQRLRCEASNSPITYVKIVNTVDYMVGAGNAAGQVTVFQIPKEHPENIPDNFKPKVERKVERYTVGELHKSKITSIEWSKNGMKLFSGDKNGVIIMTEIDFYMHLCKSMEIVNEEYEIVQMSYYQNALLVSSVYRTIVCERRDAKWHVTQIGKKERKSLCALGGVFQYSYASGTPAVAAAYCARPGHRLWRADIAGNVHHTLLFKEAISNPLTVAELLNPSQRKHEPSESDNFGPIHVFRENFLVSHNDRFLYILDPRSLTAVAVVDDLRRILSVSVSREEIFVLEGPRALIRLAHAPDLPPAAKDEPLNVMTKSLTTSIQHAVNTMRDLTQLENPVPYMTSVLEQPRSIFTETSLAEECFELPPIRDLPKDISENVLESIVNEFGSVEVDEIRRVKTEEIERKLKLYSSIMERQCESELIHSSRRGRRSLTPVRRAAPAPRDFTPPSRMAVSLYDNIEDQNDELLEKQIEEKEKMLAKMLNLESLSITQKVDVDEEQNSNKDDHYDRYDEERSAIKETVKEMPKKVNIVNNTNNVDIKKENALNLIPKVLKLPNNWNLESIEVNIDYETAGVKSTKNVLSPDDDVEADWEII